MKRYFTIFTLLLVAEIAIAVFHFHRFIRGFIGDLLVIPLLYVLGRALTKIPAKTILLMVLGLAFSVELLQLFSFTERLNIDNKIAQIILGSTFDGWDLVAYWCGILPVLYIEKQNNYGNS